MKDRVCLNNTIEGNPEYYIDKEQLGCCGVEDTLYTMIRSMDASWMPKERGRRVHTLEDNPNIGQVLLDNLTFSYEELSALRELINHFCVNKGIFNDLYTKVRTNVQIDLKSTFKYTVSSTNRSYFDVYTDEDGSMDYIGAPG
jgi:hypothetical protein